MAGCLRAGQQSAAWGPTAGAIWQLEGFQQREIIIATTRTIEPFADVRFKRVSRLGPTQLAVVSNLPTTSVPRTLLDISGCRSPKAAGAAIDSALRKKIATLGDLADYLESEARQGVSGIQRLRELLQSRSDNGDKKSFLETEFADFLLDFNLPVPKTNFLLMYEDGYTAEVDAYWPERNLIVEVQSEFHLGMTAMTRDAERILELESRGLSVVQVTAQMVRDKPTQLASQLRSLLDRAPRNS